MSDVTLKERLMIAAGGGAIADVAWTGARYAMVGEAPGWVSLSIVFGGAAIYGVKKAQEIKDDFPQFFSGQDEPD